MFATTTATREQALKAVAAAERAMERHACSKSQFKFKCFSCGKMIHRGDKITRCIKADAGMTLRYRGAGGGCGLTMAETTFYQGESGKDMWVHIGCIPCYWDSLPEDCNEYSRPKLHPIPTEWGVKVYGEWEEWTNADDSWGGLPQGAMGVPYFCMVKGYPKEKFMRDRIVHAVTRFQAIWRGYIYKKAYPEALLQAQSEQMYPPEMQEAVYAEIDEAFAYANKKWLGNGEGGENEQSYNNYPTEAQYWKEVEEASIYIYNVGDHVEVLFNAKQSSETIYSGEIIEIQYRGGMGAKIKVKYHYDDEVRKYTGKKFKLLKEECQEHKRKLGIEAKLIGRLNTSRIALVGAASDNNWRYHYPDGTPVE